MTNNETLKLLHSNSELSQKDFAEKHDISKSMLYQCSVNDKHISNNTLTRIAKKEGYKVIFNNKLEKL